MKTATDILLGLAQKDKEAQALRRERAEVLRVELQDRLDTLAIRLSEAGFTVTYGPQETVHYSRFQPFSGRHHTFHQGIEVGSVTGVFEHPVSGMPVFVRCKVGVGYDSFRKASKIGEETAYSVNAPVSDGAQSLLRFEDTLTDAIEALYRANKIATKTFLSLVEGSPSKA